MKKHINRRDLLDVVNIVNMTMVKASGDNLEPISYMQPLYLLDDYAKISSKDILNRFVSVSQLQGAYRNLVISE